MEIIHRGLVPPDHTGNGFCLRCSTIFKFDRSDCENLDKIAWLRPYGHTYCPVCNNVIVVDNDLKQVN